MVAVYDGSALGALWAECHAQPGRTVLESISPSKESSAHEDDMIASRWESALWAYASYKSRNTLLSPPVQRSIAVRGMGDFSHTKEIHEDGRVLQGDGEITEPEGDTATLGSPYL